ncbi:MAG TPA: FliH/SctL family protein [Candidatus Limnocylindria bacterium]|jgi:flagellar biosynthesis/type III secretory pathway protein FliH|nr:FliH/SctL family protein [Candidatus Limnocylindria bacterium]
MRPPPRQIKFSAPLKGVQLSLPAPPEELEAAIVQRERDAYERGRQEAERSLREQLIQQRSDMQVLQMGVLTALRNAIPEVARTTEDALIILAMEAARRLVGGLEITPGMVEAVVREALSQAEQTGRITVVLHPDDLALIQDVQSPLTHEQIGGEAIRFQPSPTVGRGGCIVQTDFGSLDARRETKFELLKQAVQT